MAVARLMYSRKMLILKVFFAVFRLCALVEYSYQARRYCAVKRLHGLIYLIRRMNIDHIVVQFSMLNDCIKYFFVLRCEKYKIS